MSTDDGKVLADPPIGAGVDAMKFDGHQAFASCRDGKLEVAGETTPGKVEVQQTVTTPVGARTMDVDPEMHKVYLATAEFNFVCWGEMWPGGAGFFDRGVVARSRAADPKLASSEL